MKRTSLVWGLIFGVMILRLTSAYFEVFRMSVPPTLDVDLWLKGDPPRPFSTRVLVPWIVLGTSRIVPDGMREYIESGALYLPVAALPSRLEYQVLGVLVILCFIGYSVYMRKLVRSILSASDLQANLITLSSLLLMPVMFAYHNYFYDPMTLFLGTALWYLVSRQSWVALFPVFALACINKETAVVFAFSAALWRYYQEGTRPAFRFFVMLAVIGLSIRAIISMFTAHFPGSAMQYHLIDHNLPIFFVFVDTLSFASTLVIGFLVFSFWNEKPRLVRIGIMHLSILVAMGMFVGYLDEYRLYFECYPILVLTMAYSLVRLGKSAAPLAGSDRPVLDHESKILQQNDSPVL